MTATSDPTGPYAWSTAARAPVLESLAARAGVSVVVALSIVAGVGYWWPRDWTLAVLTAGAELIAFAGLAIALWLSRRDWRIAAGAIAVTLLAALWCGLTMFEKVQSDSRHEQLARAREMPRYVFAENAAATARDLLADRLANPNPRPSCACPQTLRAWEDAEAAAVGRLRAERDAAVARMEAALPPRQTDWIAIFRGMGVEITKLFGFMVFGMAASPPASTDRPRQPNAAVDDCSTTHATPRSPRSCPAPTWLNRVLAGVLAGSVAAQPAQPALDPSSTATTEPPNRPVEAVAERPAAPVRPDELPSLARELATHMGERRIAARLSERYGERITRHQVRCWLGRHRADQSARPTGSP